MSLVIAGPHAGEMRFQFALQNYGKSPALTTFIAAHMAVGDKRIPKIDFALTESENVGPVIVPPGDKPMIVAYSDVLTPVEAALYTNQEIILYGTIQYTDIFGAPKPKYVLGFCNSIWPNDATPTKIDPKCNGRNYIN